MKTSTQTTVILKAFDLELKGIIQSDLKKFKEIKDIKATFKQFLAA